MQSVLPLFVQAKAEETYVLHRPVVVVGVFEDVTNEHFVQVDRVHGCLHLGVPQAQGLAGLAHCIHNYIIVIYPPSRCPALEASANGCPRTLGEGSGSRVYT
jgi:hypothetical protein